MRVNELIIEPGRAEHIARHGVEVTEVQDVVFGPALWMRAREGRFLVIGQTAGGRYLAVVLARRVAGVFGLVTARNANEAERRRLRERRR